MFIVSVSWQPGCISFIPSMPVEVVEYIICPSQYSLRKILHTVRNFEDTFRPGDITQYILPEDLARMGILFLSAMSCVRDILNSSKVL